MTTTAGIPRDAEDLVLFLLEQGSKRDAIRVYQEEAGVGRAEAKRAVRGLARRRGVAPSDMGIADLVIVALMLFSLLLGLVVH